MKVFVIVVTFNGLKWIEKCFGSLVASSIPLQILAIDNASSDDTVSQIRNQFPEVEIIETGSNLGFGKANNIGLKKALDENADYVFLLNQDAWIETGTIEKLLIIAKEHKEFGILSSFHLLPDGRGLEWYFSTYISPENCPGLYSDMYSGKMKSFYKCDFINAAAWLISKECLKSVGGFDPLFFHYGEDEDYCQRLLYKQMELAVVPEAKIFHDINYKSWSEIKNNKGRDLIFKMLELKDVRYSLSYLFAKYTLNHFSNVLLNLGAGNIKKAFGLFKDTLKGYSKIGEISKSRKQSKSEFAYLN